MRAMRLLCLARLSADMGSGLRTLPPAIVGRATPQRAAVRACATVAAAQGQQGKKKVKNQGGGGGGRKGLTPRATDYSLWYQEVIAAGDLVDQSPVKGCMVIKPTGMALWDCLRNELDARIKASGAENAYFPLFIPVSFLSRQPVKRPSAFGG